MTAIRLGIRLGIRESLRADSVLVWTLCDPARSNPVSPMTLRWNVERAAQLSGEVVVLRGEGHRVFCAGFDLAALADDAGGQLPDAPLAAAVTAMRAADATFVAALDGHAVGAGVELACACDVRLARRDITFEVPAARLGVIYRAQGLALLEHTFGHALVRRLVLLGERIGAQEAYDRGAIERVADAADFEATLEDVVHRLRSTPHHARRGNRDVLRQMVPEIPLLARTEHELRRAQAFAEARLRLQSTSGLPKAPAPGLGLPPMAIKDEIDARQKQARRDRDEVTLNIIGMLKNRVLTELKSGAGVVEDDALWLAMIGAYVKQLRKSIPEFERAGERGKQAIVEVTAELKFCEQFLPTRLDEAATEALVRTLVGNNGLAGQGAKASGRVMGMLMKEHKDVIDGEIARVVVARVLAET